MKQLFKDYEIELTDELQDKLLLQYDTILIPSKTEAKLKYFTKQDLQSVNEDIEVAKELILVILSNFSNTYVLSMQSNNSEAVKKGFKILNATILSKQVNIEATRRATYKTILELLIKYKMIEKGRNYSQGQRSNEFRLADTFFGKGIIEYKLKTDILKKRNFKSVEENLEKVLQCPIATSELLNRQFIEFPSDAEAKKHLIGLAKKKATNKKGKVLVYLNKRDREDFKNSVFIEDYLEILKYLQKIIIPIIVSDRGGNRVITAFNFLPSVLRPLCKFNGESLVEADYSCLHPNISQLIFGGYNKEAITHEKVADYLKVERSVAKIGHLSFFNQTWEQIYYSPLFEYYNQNEPQMMINIYEDKTENGHKKASQDLFSFEVELMRENIKSLNTEGIRVLTAFDAIYCSEKDYEKVKEIMNKNAEMYGILSTVS
jgi:hypothetical protein